MEALPVLLIILVVAAAIYAGYYAKKKRRELMTRMAGEMNARFSEEDPYRLASRHEGLFSTLRTGSNRYAQNVIAGEWEGRDFWLFDHHYETYSHNKNGRQTHHHHRTFLLTEHEVHLGSLEVRPEGIFDKLKAAFGFDDVDFESAEFSRAWYVGAEDRELAYQIFHPLMIEYFLTLDGFRLSTGGPFALCRVGSGRMNESEMRRTLRYASGFHERLPRFVRKDRAL